jgi:hypothetical protein
MMQLGLAMHNYHSKHGTFPPAAVCSADGKPLLSWRVLILPYIAQDNLLQEFKLDEPWDSPHNILLLERMPKVYEPYNGFKTPQPYVTYYQVFDGRGAMFDGPQRLKIGEITDGLSNTFMIVEAGEPVPWTKPADLPYAADKPLPALGGLFADGGFRVALGDGSVRTMPRGVPEETLRALITPNGSEKIDWSRVDAPFVRD